MRPLLALAILAAIFGGLTSFAAVGKEPRAAPDGAAVVREMNLARQHPEVYAGFVAELRTQFRGNIRVLPGRWMPGTREGVGAVDEAIRFLQHARPLAPLIASPGIARAAAQHAADQASGSIGHRGSDFSDAGDRMNRHGTWQTLWGENISYGKSSAREVVLALIIDDGLRGRKHRKNIFNPTFAFAGAAIGPHARYRTVCSIDFAAGYVEAGTGARSLFARN